MDLDAKVSADRSHVIEVGARGACVHATEGAIQVLHQQFQRDHYVLFPGFLDGELLTRLQAQVHDSEFLKRVHGDIGREEWLSPEHIAVHTLEFVCNNQRIFELVEAVTNCGHVGSFHGRLYQMLAAQGHHDSWHGDIGLHRVAAMTVNVSAEQFEGGVLQIREPGGRIVDVPTPGYGDAIVFRIAPGFVHQVTIVSGASPRRAWAGWFRSEPDIMDLVRGRMAGESQ